MVVDPTAEYNIVVAMEGNERTLAIKDTSSPVLLNSETGKVVWQGKNANDTPLKLASVYKTECAASITKSIFVCGDQTGRLRFFDSAVQKKPVLELPIYETYVLSNHYTGTSGMGNVRPVKVLTLSPDKKDLYVGDTYGIVIVIDLTKAIVDGKLVHPTGDAVKLGFKAHKQFCRKLFPMKFSCKGIMGSIRSIAVTETTVYVVTAGRFAYEFDVKSKGKRYSYKMYLKDSIPEIANTEESECGDDLVEDSNDELARELLDTIDEGEKHPVYDGATVVRGKREDKRRRRN